ncbi:MAG: hypothetical protein WBM50_15810 [Acidimicrobiales bacterium]
MAGGGQLTVFSRAVTAIGGPGRGETLRFDNVCRRVTGIGSTGGQGIGCDRRVRDGDRIGHDRRLLRRIGWVRRIAPGDRLRARPGCRRFGCARLLFDREEQRVELIRWAGACTSRLTSL